MSNLAVNHSALGTTAPPPTAMSPHDPGLFSLLNSLFEPNFLILVSYLCINLYLASRVIRVATKRYRQLSMAPKEYGEMGLVQVPVDGDTWQTAHEELFRIGKTPKKVQTDTPVADALIKLAAWAFKNKARHAKYIFALLAVLSLASTWFYMISFLRHSYLAYLERCHLTSFPLPPTPPPFDLTQPGLLVPALHLRILRISQWLGSLSLFKEAWMEVIKDSTSWWWSSEICIITVGAWALFLRHEAERLRIPHVWTVMTLGQLVAISFAFNLFNLAVVYRLDAYDLVAARSNTIFKARHRVFKPLEEDEGDSPPDISPQPEYERVMMEERGGYRVAVSAPRRAGHSPIASPSTSLPPTPRDSPDPNIRMFSTTITVKKTPLPPLPTFMDKVGSAMRHHVPEKYGMPLFILAGLSSVLQHPNSFTKVMVMHVFPLLVTLYAACKPPRALAPRRPSARSPFRPATPHLTTRQILLKMVSRPKLRVPLWKDAKMYYLGLGAVSIVLRLWLTLACFFEVDGDPSVLHRAVRTMASLFPTTFFRHPAQSSISSDHVCVALSASVFVLVESGLWLWKAAVASPSAELPPICDPDEEAEGGPGDMQGFPLPSSLRLDRADRHVIETQARAVMALLILSPLLGGSATLSLYLAARCTWVEQYERHRIAQDDEILRLPQAEGSDTVIEDKEEINLVENEEGERYMEVRSIKVRECRPRGAGGGAARAQPAQPAARHASEDGDLPTPSSTSTFMLESEDDIGGSQTEGRARRRTRGSTADSEAASGHEEDGRRHTPMRQRHPPQRYGDPLPTSPPGRRA